MDVAECSYSNLTYDQDIAHFALSNSTNVDDPDLSEFVNLSNLASEFYLLDRSCFPFCHLAPNELRDVYGLPAAGDGDLAHPMLRGNYVAGSILRDLRISSQANGFHFRDLTFIFNLPTELTLEIFEHLHPIDLYSLIRSSKGLRSLLLDPKSSAIWRQVFDRHRDIPPCPPDLSLPKWASMLFGPSTCDICGDPEAMVDFTFRARRCQSCMDNLCLFTDEFEHFAEDLEEREVLWTLVKDTSRTEAMTYPSVYYYTILSKYSKSEVDETARQMKQFLSAIEANIPNAREEYARFKIETSASVRDSMKHIKTCNMWCLRIYDNIIERFEELVPSLTKVWQKRLVALGHNPQDIEEMSEDIQSMLYDLRDSKKAFRRFMPWIDRLLSKKKASRLAREHQLLILKRQNEVEAFYDAYLQQSLNPATWEHLPEVDHIFNMQTISRYIHFGDISGAFPADVARQDIQMFVSKWVTFGRRHLSQIIHKSCMTESGKDPLELSAAIFTCPCHKSRGDHPLPLFGWQEAALHLTCIIPSDTEFAFKDASATSGFAYSLAGYDIVKHLLGYLGLDPNKVSANELEALNARFVCTTCPLHIIHGAKGRYSMSIKQCVSHALGYPEFEHTPWSFVPITEEAIKSVLFHEDGFSSAADRSWNCMHCSDYFKVCVSRKTVVTHVKEAHSIPRPSEETDFFYRRSKYPIQRKRYFLASDPPINRRCNKCLDSKKPRLWSRTQLWAHLKDKHDIQDPIPNVDWIEIDFYKEVSSKSDK